MFQTSESCIKVHAVVVLEHFLSEQCPLLQVCVCVSTAPSVCVCVCVHCSRCVCVSTAPCVCVCPLLQVCVHLDGSNAENKISLLVILCIIMYVTKKKKNLNRYLFFYKTDNGKMLKYREKYRSTDISVDL